MNPIEQEIFDRLNRSFDPTHIEIENDSQHHSGPAKESHFRVLLVSQVFEGVSRLERQRKVVEVLRDLLDGPVHAFSQRLLTPEEAKEKGAIPELSKCLGGGKS